jgi:7-cyano-7-deazaguanine synthase
MSDSPITAVLLASGGLDSTTLAYWLKNQGIAFVPVFLNYGQHCAETERERLAEVLPATEFGTIITLNIADVYKGCSSRLITRADLWEEKITGDDLYLPYRNLLMLATGAAYAQSRGLSEVYAAFINSNHAKEIDCSAEFFERLGGMLSDFGTVKIQMPFRDLPKRSVAELGLSLCAPIARTFSCQASSAVACGACPNCRDRLAALEGLE